MNIEKQALPVFIDSNTQEPIAILYFNKNRERIVYNLIKSDEESIIELFNQSKTQAQDTPTAPERQIEYFIPSDGVGRLKNK